jgi:hypothetical protein
MSITRATATLACLGMALISADARACGDNRYAFTCKGMTGPGAAAETEPARGPLDLLNFAPPESRRVLPFMPMAKPAAGAPLHDAVAAVERAPLPRADPRPIPQRTAAVPARSAPGPANEQLRSADQPEALAAASLQVSSPPPPARSRRQAAASEPMPAIERVTSASIEQEEARMRTAMGMGATAADENADAAAPAPASALADVAATDTAPAATSWWKRFLLAWGGVLTLGSALRFIIG